MMRNHFTPFSRSLKREARRGFRLAFLAATLCGGPKPASAHGDLDGQIREVSKQIEKGATAALYLKRGELHHDHEDYVAALADYDHATLIDPELNAILLSRGRTLFQAGRPQSARAALDLYLKKKPDHAEGFLLRGRVLASLGDHSDAVQDFDRNLALTPQPLPECFLERADALVALGDKEAAVKGIDEGLGRLGNLVTLQAAVIAIELTRNGHDAALARVDRVMADLRRKETWLTRRGEILDAAGRRDEARRAYEQALGLIERLPAQHRHTKPMLELEARLRQLLGP